MQEAPIKVGMIAELTGPLSFMGLANANVATMTIEDINAGEALSTANVWVKRPGTGEIKATDFDRVLGRRATRSIPVNTQVRWSDLM